MSAPSPSIIRLLVGRVRPMGPGGPRSGIHKQPSPGPLWLTTTGFEGDEQGDLRHHGGADKAVHHYAAEHYRAWREELGPCPALKAPAPFGENVSVRGLTETDVAVGDIFRVGGAVLQVSQGRQPCWKLNLRFERPDMARRVQASGRTGWYYRVLEPGFVTRGDTLQRLERPAPAWTLDRIWRAFYVRRLDREDLAGIAELTWLTPAWRELARRRLATGEVESWSARLSGAAAAAPPTADDRPRPLGGPPHEG